MSCHALLVLNPGARRGRDAAPERIEACLASFGVDAILVRPPPDGIADAVRIHLERVDRVIVGGGDGTLNAAVQGIVERPVPLGILPLGTANNLARTLGLPTDLEAACAVAAGSQRRRIDLGWVNGRYFLTTASIGLSVAITEELSGPAKRFWGPLAYVLAALRILSRSRPFRAELVWEGGRRSGRTVQVVVGNGRYYGAGLPVAEDAKIDDARLDVYSLEIRHWWELLALAPALRRGRHGERRQVAALTTTEVELRTPHPLEINLDGEIGCRTPARFRVVPGAIEVLVRNAAA